MNRILSILKENYLIKNYETALYLLAAIFLLLAIIKPEIQLKQQVHNYLLIADVSQSMNAEDAMLGTKHVSRLAFTQQLMKKVVETSPCGTHISIGVYAADNVALLVSPLEVCANYDGLIDSIDHLEWRMAWKGNSRISFGIRAAANIYDSLNIPAKLLFFTDGDEAPLVNVTIKQDLSGVQMGDNFIFVGVGEKIKVGVPRYNAANKLVGYWPINENNNSGAVSVTYADTSLDDPDPPVAAAEYDRYLSSLSEEYLQGLTKDIKGKYIKGQDSTEFYEFVQQQKPVAKFVTAYSVKWLYLLLAMIAILATFMPNIVHRVRFGSVT